MYIYIYISNFIVYSAPTNRIRTFLSVEKKSRWTRDGDGGECVAVSLRVCLCVRVYAERGDQGLEREVVVTKGRFLFLQDVSLSATPLYGGPISILGKSTLGIENGDEGAGGRRDSELQEVGGQGVAVATVRAREEMCGGKEENRGAVFTKGHVVRARPPFF